MIKINLLPPEFRQAEGTPLPVFLLILVGLVVAALGVVALFWMNQQVQTNKENLETLKNVQRQLIDKISERDKLKKDLHDKRAQKDTILQIRKNRILWAKKLFRLANRTPSKSVWWQWVRMNQNDPKRGLAHGGELIIDCYQKGVQESTLDAYRDAIQKDKVFWLGFKEMSPPAYNYVEWPNADTTEKDTLHFTLSFFLKPPDVPPPPPPPAKP
ncbi:MAG: PilN domain-containing protein [Planctomycetota bacterium]|jgi:hypothetical protein